MEGKLTRSHACRPPCSPANPKPHTDRSHGLARGLLGCLGSLTEGFHCTRIECRVPRQALQHDLSESQVLHRNHGETGTKHMGGVVLGLGHSFPLVLMSKRQEKVMEWDHVPQVANILRPHLLLSCSALQRILLDSTEAWQCLAHISDENLLSPP